jgi:hypothetical protein
MREPNDKNEPRGQNEPKDLAWNWQGPRQFRPFSGQQAWLRKGGLRVPPPAGPPPKLSKAERDQERRADERAERMHLAGLTSVGAIIMSVVVAAVVIVLVLVLISHH